MYTNMANKLCVLTFVCVYRKLTAFFTNGQPARTQNQPSFPYNQDADPWDKGIGTPPTRADTKSELVPIVQTHRTTRTQNTARTQLMKHITQNTDML